MVLFVDLDDDDAEPPGTILTPHYRLNHHRGLRIAHVATLDEKLDEGRVNPNKNAITEALGCYPIIASIASHIDLNTLDALSLTCRQVRANLLQFRTQLLASTLHCENEDVELDPEHTFRYRARAADWYFIDAGRDAAGVVGKVGNCARDMVGGCRRCGRVTCRNCTIKPPAPVLLRHRLRRICTSCQRAPLSTLITPSHHPINDPPTTTTSSPLPTPTNHNTSTLTRQICACSSTGVYLCQPCGRSLRSADNEYESIWRWRTRYLPSLGGLGVGIGEGNRGVPCGRGGECVAAREVEQETDCDAEDARDSGTGSPSLSPSPGKGNGSGNGSGSPRSSIRSESMGVGYARHEIEGIGGVMKKKLVRMVRVGACVAEYGEEKENGRFLVREVEGRARSWCGWCWRVVPGVGDGVV